MHTQQIVDYINKAWEMKDCMPVTDMVPATSLLSEATLSTLRPYGRPLPSP